MQMATKKLKCWHIYHSGTAIYVPEEETLHIFDYYRQEGDRFPGHWQKNFSPRKTYIYVSHGHGDHYSSDIFSWSEKFADLRYILSSDLQSKTASYRNQNLPLKYLSPGDKITAGGIIIKAYESTDEGISLLIEEGRRKYFHAGDLNWWDWESFSPEERKREERDYKKTVDKLQNAGIDLAFVPVDPRLGESYHLAAEYFMRTVKPEVLVPIHIADNYSITSRFRQKFADMETEIIEISRPGEEFDIELRG